MQRASNIHLTGWFWLALGAACDQPASTSPQDRDAAALSAPADAGASVAPDAAARALGDEAPAADAGTADAALLDPAGSAALLRFRSDVEPVTSAAQAKPGVFIPPFDDCRDPVPGEPPGMGPDGKVCTHVMISGCTEPGRYFPDYASCDVVRTQRPFWEAPPAAVPKQDDPRLSDPAFMKELAWATEQVEACACTCCHDSRVKDGKVGQWDIHRGPIWLDTLSDSGLALFVGAADSSALGAYPAADNHGFDRERTGIPTTDTARMQAFLEAELQRRGISREEAEAVPPFGGPIYQNRLMKPGQCAGQGVDAQDRVQLGSAQVRYVYVLDEAADNPGVPPNQDLPQGTLWRIDVLASAAPLAGPLRYGSTPQGSFQVEPAAASAPPLVLGARYKLYALRDVGLPVINCLFTYGEPLGQAPAAAEPAEGADPGPADASGADAGAGGAAVGGACSEAASDVTFGSSCKDGMNHTDCPCAPADYCAVMPGQTAGYCTAQGCKEDPSVCPSGWSCFDLSAFSPGLPSICMQP